jgi:hypothetical protein
MQARTRVRAVADQLRDRVGVQRAKQDVGEALAGRRAWPERGRAVRLT